MNWKVLGIRADQPGWQQERIKVATRVLMTLAVVLGTLLLTSLIFRVGVMTTFVGFSLLILIAILFAHAAGHHRVSRMLIATLPVIVSSVIQGAYQVKGQLPNASGFIYIITFQVLPFLLFAPNEKTLRRTSVFINVIMAASYELFNEWIEIAPPDTTTYQVFITNFIGILMVLQLLQTIDSIYLRSNQENLELLSTLEQEKEEQRQAREALHETIEKLNASKAEEDKRTWATKGIAEIAKISRDEKDQQKMLDHLISFLVKYMQANQGMLFELEEDGSEKYLSLKACYAYERKKFLQRKIVLGEGLIGQCYYEKRPVFMTDIPEEYVQITSGLGHAKPRSLLIVPIMLNNQVFGVFELASFRKFEAHEISFAMDVGESIATSIQNFKVNARTNYLLQETQLLAEQMKAQDEAMRINMEEIAAAQEEQLRVEAELREIIKMQEEQLNLMRQTPLNNSPVREPGVFSQQEPLPYLQSMNS